VFGAMVVVDRPGSVVVALRPGDGVVKKRKMERLGLADGSFVGESEGAPVGVKDRAELFVGELDGAADLISNPPSEGGLAWT